MEATGLGVFLKFNMDTLPHKLGFCIVNCLDTSDMKLVLKCGSLAIDERDVEEILGLPRGPTEMDLNIYAEEVHDSWASQFGQTEPHKFRIKSVQIAKAISEERSPTENFKRNVMVIIYNTLIEPSRTAQVNRDILNFIGDVDRLSQYNWCKLAIDSLSRCKDKWNAYTNFTGPLAFLILLYVDRVCLVGKRSVPRTTPSWLAWTNNELQSRYNQEETNGLFGEGTLRMPAWAGERGQDLPGKGPVTAATVRHDVLVSNLQSGPSHHFEEFIMRKFEAYTIDIMESIIGYNGCMDACADIVSQHPRIKEIHQALRKAVNSIKDPESTLRGSASEDGQSSENAHMDANVSDDTPDTSGDTQVEGDGGSDDSGDANTVL